MLRHIHSFVRAPLGYIANFVASATYRIPGINHPCMAWIDYPICWASRPLFTILYFLGFAASL